MNIYGYLEVNHIFNVNFTLLNLLHVTKEGFVNIWQKGYLLL